LEVQKPFFEKVFGRRRHYEAVDLGCPGLAIQSGESRTAAVLFWKTHDAIHVSFARPVSFGHLPEAPSSMNCILLPKAEPLPDQLVIFLKLC
jgi:hypothetical protein